MARIEHDELQEKTNKNDSQKVKAVQLLGSGMKEDEVQELAEHRDDGWEFVDES
ncbi:hypothetical protein KR50_20360 [Jeotgalibacillus campisalis]|uniref:Uncharacterized protein n=2 Tax=Jeotgalibacillus campisalis TaxID=220754 RepID=A0A0C2S1E6_9BACL|nr:hypothetical protein KR50_20360 [Jeotgalibacillus campisalis]